MLLRICVKKPSNLLLFSSIVPWYAWFLKTAIHSYIMSLSDVNVLPIDLFIVLNNWQNPLIDLYCEYWYVTYPYCLFCLLKLKLMLTSFALGLNSNELILNAVLYCSVLVPLGFYIYTIWLITLLVVLFSKYNYSWDYVPLYIMFLKPMMLLM